LFYLCFSVIEIGEEQPVKDFINKKGDSQEYAQFNHVLLGSLKNEYGGCDDEGNHNNPVKKKPRQKTKQKVTSPMDPPIQLFVKLPSNETSQVGDQRAGEIFLGFQLD
jgi:hypothetical protein